MKNDKHLVLDIGNTNIKYGYFEEATLKKSGMCTDWTAKQWATFFEVNPLNAVLIATVGASTKKLVAKFPKTIKVHFLNKLTNYPFTSNYDDITTLGIDRKAALAGTLMSHPNKAVLIIDAGSCITYDFMDEKAIHKGGVISPGRVMRYHAMHLFTNKLPFLTPISKIPIIGTSTKTSMEKGVEEGVIAEINAHIDAFNREYGNFTIILTGGDADFLIKKIKNTIFADADLTLKGLYCLLMLNSLHEK